MKTLQNWKVIKKRKFSHVKLKLDSISPILVLCLIPKNVIALINIITLNHLKFVQNVILDVQIPKISKLLKIKSHMTQLTEMIEKYLNNLRNYDMILLNITNLKFLINLFKQITTMLGQHQFSLVILGNQTQVWLKPQIMRLQQIDKLVQGIITSMKEEEWITSVIVILTQISSLWIRVYIHFKNIRQIHTIDNKIYFCVDINTIFNSKLHKYDNNYILKEMKSSKQTINPLKILQKTHKDFKINNISKTKPIHKPSLLVEQLSSNKQASNNKKVTLKQNKPKNYKTKMCPQGRQCKRQFTCTFAHNEYQLRKPFMKRTKICVMYQHGKCSLGAACRQYHGNLDLMKNYQYKKQLCNQYMQKGICNKEKLCIYKHGQNDNGALDSQNEQEQIMQQANNELQINQNAEIIQRINEQKDQNISKQKEILSPKRLQRDQIQPKVESKSHKIQIQKLENAKPQVQDQLIVFSFS